MSTAALGLQRGLRAGVERFGLLNPLIYRLARRGSRAPLFRDVTAGDSDVFGVGCCDARRDYDRATGWGSVDLARLADRALAASSRGPATFTGRAPARRASD